MIWIKVWKNFKYGGTTHFLASRIPLQIAEINKCSARDKTNERKNKMKLITKTLAGIASLLLLAQGLNADTVSYNATHIAGSADTSFLLNQFNTSLFGTLTGVTVTVDYSTLSGSFTVKNTGTSSATVTGYSSNIDIWGSTAGIGFSELITSLGGHSGTIITSPDWSGYYLAAGDSQAFTIGSNQSFYTNVVQNIASGNLNAYKGSGTVLLKANNTQTITTSGSSYELTSGAAGANTSITVTYTYDAVPEPTTVGLLLGASGLGIVAAVRRRRAKA